MTHFLARLVGRARGTALRVEPIIASSFAPPAPAGMAIEHESLGTNSEPSPAGPETKAVSEAPAPIRSESGSISGASMETSREVDREVLLVPQFRDPSSSSDSPERHAIEVEDVHTAPAWSQAARRARTKSARPRTPDATSPLSSPREQLREEAPIVRVTIGRIDVRAAAEPPSPPRKPARRAEPKLTLDAYLQSRKEGGR
jgi:hypothetical protein